MSDKWIQIAIEPVLGPPEQLPQGEGSDELEIEVEDGIENMPLVEDVPVSEALPQFVACQHLHRFEYEGTSDWGIFCRARNRWVPMVDQDVAFDVADDLNKGNEETLKGIDLWNWRAWVSTVGSVGTGGIS